ncbi:amino acid adenylation domain-containing protein, partial [Pedobacter sp. UYP1]|uniref:non-ribosomal peptide synthetase n=1 Tax=Pedobacter sp. UYP1 TaxID=1756396 RepID=UPI003398BA48
MRNIIKLILELADLNVNIYLEEGKLKIDSPDDLVLDDFLPRIKLHKEELIQYLSTYKPDSDVIEIPIIETQETYPLSSSQYRLWILSQFTESSIAYNMPGVFVFEGVLDEAAFSYAFASLIERHEILRTVFTETSNGEVRQQVKTPEALGFKVGYQDLSGAEPQAVVLESLINTSLLEIFDLSAGPLLRANVYRLGNGECVFSYVMHHIISDGWSMGVLIKELLLLYNSYVQGAVSPLLPLRIQYKDYAAWQQGQLTGAGLKDHQQYWLDQFSGALPVLALPSDKVRPVVKSYNGRRISRLLGSAISSRLKAFVNKHDSTLFMGLLAGVNSLLYRYSGQDDIIIGTPIAGREHSDLEDQLGYYANTLALRSRFHGTDSFTGLLLHVREQTLNGYEHQVYPFDQLVSDLQLQRDMSRSALFDVIVELQITETGEQSRQNLSGLKVRGYQGSKQVISKFDLTFTFVEQGDDLQLSIEFNTDIFQEQRITQLALHVEQLLESALDQPLAAISGLDYISAVEKEKLVVSFNQSRAIYPEGKTVIDLFEEQAVVSANQVALAFEDKELSYGQLNSLANQLAGYLRSTYHLKGGELIGICQERSELLLVSILGVLKSGCAYVPIDPGYPQERIDYMLSDSGCTIVLDEEEIKKFKLSATGYSKENLQLSVSGRELAYVIYTSGSTGLPKGCAVSHGSLFNYISWADGYYFTDKGSTPDFGLYTSLSFDLTVTSIFCCLTLGGKLLIYGQYEDISWILSHSFSMDSGLNSIKLTPSHINMLEHLDIGETQISCVIVGGEEVSSRHVEILKQISSSLVIYNEYGPTEATVGCIVQELELHSAVLIGKPIANTRIYILGEGTGLSGIGMAGEICIGGDGLARGYLHNGVLTAEKFVSNPFEPGERMYRTGDLGRWLEDGNIEYLGRKDDQVKIRGYRIELGEIEAALRSYPGVEGVVVTAGVEGAVVTAGGRTEKELVAYVVSHEELNISDLRVHLSRILPDYMLPAHFVQLDEIPLNANGKTDRKSL